MNKKTNISILIPARNAEDYVLDCLNSVYFQLEENDEILIIENNSSDATKSIILDYIKDKERIKCICLEKTVSLFESRKLAIEESNAESDYLIFLDSDDLLMKNALLTVKELINRFSLPDMLIYRTMFFDQLGDLGESINLFSSTIPQILNDNQKNELFKVFFFSDNINNVWLKCVKRTMIIQEYIDFKGYSNYTYIEDKIHTSIFIKKCKKIAYVPSILHKYRKHISAATKKVSLEWIFEFLHVCRYFDEYLTNDSEMFFYSNDSECFFKTQFCKLIVWYIGQNKLGLKETKNNIKSIKKFITDKSLFISYIHATGKRYELVYKLINKNRYCMLYVVSKLFVKIMKV